MARRPCVQCPFKQSSAYCYDDDAHEALAGGNSPACHMQVGHDSIYAHAPMDPPEGVACAGYVAWTQDKPGFREPARIDGVRGTSNEQGGNDGR